MSKIAKSAVKIGGENGFIIHDKLCADGPVGEDGKPLIDPETGQPYRGKNDDMADMLHDYTLALRSQIMINNGNTRIPVPRYGILSLMAESTPIYVYDHPALKKLANTAFTDGTNIFIDADFMRKMVEQEQEFDGYKSGVMFVLVHELMHKLLCHVTRLKAFPKDIANQAEDFVINGKIRLAFPEIAPIPLLVEMGLGMKPEDADKYASMAEEVVAEMLLAQREKNAKQKQSQQAGDGSDQNTPQSGAGDNQAGGGSSDGSSGGDKKKKNGSGGGGEPEYSDIHHITPEELVQALEENGLYETVGKTLDLPRSDDAEGMEKMKKRTELSKVDAIQRALSQSARCESGSYPGGHIAEEAAEVVEGLLKGKLSWKLGLKKLMMGSGIKMGHTDDEAAIFMYIDKEVMGVDPWFEGSLVPQQNNETILVLVDTSGSTGYGDMRREFLQEALGLKRGVASNSESAKKVILWSADTVLRGTPIEITDYNMNKLANEGIPIFGNGGTDFKTCLDQALGLPSMKKEKVTSVVYFTDCCDNPPTRYDFEEHLNKGMKITFITTPGMWNESWNKSVGDWAEVYCIEEGTKVNLDAKAEIKTDTRKNSM